ncbi:MAG: 2-amino-4-hydroxy-6-hydroxymethyldihydropteridine diphosphokinase [Candidatus Omnitrophica bacterium]|nr:2-amino-4-hydroxy-6-hydroxymethyldihydropteridine diphosphokinase [Candidatus Omnitrophota bacterium]
MLERLKEIENLLGRKKTKRKWAPREIDLDILFYGNTIIKEKNLFVPHKEIKKRWFVLKPMSDIAPGLRHPVLKSTIKVMLREYENSERSQADAAPSEIDKKRR